MAFTNCFSGKGLIKLLKILVILGLIVFGIWWLSTALLRKFKKSNNLNHFNTTNVTDITTNITEGTTNVTYATTNITEGTTNLTDVTTNLIDGTTNVTDITTNLINGTTNVTDTVTVSVYYETYCPDCVDFILQQLYPSHVSLREKLIIDFVPFGKAKQYNELGNLQFACQHGPKECMGNKLHACAIRATCEGRRPQDCHYSHRARLVEFVFCNEQNEDHIGSAKECAKKAGLDADEVIKCSNSTTGSELMSGYGNQTSNYRLPIGWNLGFVPSVAIDGVPNHRAVNDLMGQICKLRPTLC